MANFEVLSLDPTTPQIRAPGAGDGYSVPRDMTLEAGTTLTAPTVNATTVDATNVEVTNIKAKDGTAAGSIADSTGVVTLGSSVLTTTDINGGSIDGTTIGANSAAAGTFTTVSATTGNITTVNATTVDATNVEVTNIKAKDGTAAATIADSTGVVSLSANPVLSGGTANGVLYLNGSKVATSGSALTFDGTGKLGVGTTTPVGGISAGFEAVGEIWASTASSNANQIRLSPATSGANIIYSTYSGSGSYLPLAFNVSGSEQMRLNSTGLGIGTTSPSGRLHISTASGNTDFYHNVTGAGTAARTVYTRGGSVQFYAGLGAWSGTDTYQIAGASGPLTTLDASGNLGLGVTPSAWSGLTALQVSGTAALYATNSVTGLSFNQYFNGTNNIYLQNDFSNRLQIDSGAFKFFTAPSGTAGNAITFTQAATLDANGTWLVGTTTAPAGATSANKYSVVKGSTEGVLVFGKANTGGGAITGNAGAGILFYTYTGTDGSETYSERMRLDSSGNLGIGVTPSAWNTVTALQIKNASFIGFSETAYMAGNAYYNSGWKYITNSRAGRYDIDGGASEHRWYTAASGTAGNAITFTQAMTLDADGELGIGVTSPTSRLDVAGPASAGLTNIVKLRTGSGNSTGLEIKGNYSTEDWLINNFYSGYIAFGTNNAERARITAGGDLLVGTTAQQNLATCTVLQATASNSVYAAHNSATSGDNNFIWFGTEAGGTTRGSITYNRGAGQVAYNVTSDARLKENIADAEEAGSKIDAMQVRQFDWKETGNHLDYGFVAQELHEVAPHAVSKPEDDETMWSVDYSKLVPMLVKEIQSLRARVAALEA